MNATQEQAGPTTSEESYRNPIAHIRSAEAGSGDDGGAVTRRKSMFARFVGELRRRRVCRAATTYAVTIWLVYQVAELVFPALAMPEWTVKFVIALGIFGFPVTLILSWMIQITSEGLVMDGANKSESGSLRRESEGRRSLDMTLDCGLLFVALIIGMHMTVATFSAETAAAQARPHRIVVLPFHVASGRNAGLLSQGLMIELQRELTTYPELVVIAPRREEAMSDSVALTGSVAIGEKHVRVTAILINNATDEIVWSHAFEQARDDSPTEAVRLAKEIVVTLPFLVPQMADNSNAT